MVYNAVREDVLVIQVRVRYLEGVYRSHHNSLKDIDLVYRDYCPLPSKDINTLVIPDTYATGRSAEASIQDLLEKGFTIWRIILYGFIAIPALIRLDRLAFKEGVELVCFALGNIMQLAENNYDMPLYGIDESLYSSSGEVMRLGSIVDIQTLRDYLPHYVAGMDQPRDWSERQNLLFTGDGYERGGIITHLQNSIELANSLMEINSGTSWFNDFHRRINRREVKRLEETLEKYRNSCKD
jgi:hypothetical protein